MKVISNGKSFYTANRNFSPLLKQNIKLDLLPSKTFKIEGIITLDLIEKNAKTVIVRSDIDDKKFTDKIIEILNQSFLQWDLSKFVQFQKVEIPFYARGKKNTQNKFRLWLID